MIAELQLQLEVVVVRKKCL